MHSGSLPQGNLQLTEYHITLMHRSRHAHMLNSLGLKLVHISNETGDPTGGLIDRHIKKSEPTILLYEMGEFLSERIPALDPHQIN